jgi:hypothetical protein
MYSELFRLLGWIHPTPGSRLNFILTWLGNHIQEAGIHSQPLVRECVLGIVFPNEVVEAKGAFRLRPFAAILRSLLELDGFLCRDEMILGPLSLHDDTDVTQFKEMIIGIKNLRGSPARLEKALLALSKKNRIQINTLKNYTRFPLAILEWAGWTIKVREKSIYGLPIVFHRLSDQGNCQAKMLNSSMDVRGDNVAGKSSEISHALAKLAAVSMLERAGYDTAQLCKERAEWIRILQKDKILRTGQENIIFSPFQELAPALVQSIFSGTSKLAYSKRMPGFHKIAEVPAGRESRKLSTVRVTRSTRDLPQASHGPIETRIRGLIAQKHSIRQVAQTLMNEFKDSNRDSFYPAVSELFRCIGYDCQTSRGGVNYQRADALINHPTDSVPIEIKSPTEEYLISVNGVRQALENKIILLARHAAPTRRETTSLVVGFLLPTDRAEVSDLVNDIYRAFGISIGIVDFRSLLLLAGATISGFKHNRRVLLSLRGIIDVATS